MAETGKKLKGWRLLKWALANRKAAVMLAFGFSSGLPFALLTERLVAKPEVVFRRLWLFLRGTATETQPTHAEEQQP